MWSRFTRKQSSISDDDDDDDDDDRNILLEQPKFGGSWIMYAIVFFVEFLQDCVILSKKT